MNAQRSQNDFLRAQYERSVDNIVADLRHLADGVERAKRISDQVARPYLSQATGVVHDVMCALPNLNFGRLIETAHDCETLMEVDGG